MLYSIIAKQNYIDLFKEAPTMNTQKDIDQLTRLLLGSVSTYHCILTASQMLDEAGFARLNLTEDWDLEPKHGYYLPVFDSSLIAFTTGSQHSSQVPALRTAAAHTD